MALQGVYAQFLAAPSSSLLAPDASLHYITTTTSYKTATEIIKHISASRNQVKKKKEDFLSIVEGQNAVAVEVDTTLEFLTSGGPYLPSLDDNFLSDRTVFIPITHMVIFDADGKITQIRQNWDQGAMLKQLDVIGKTGRNWPIRDSKEQIGLIESCLKLARGSPDAVASADAAQGNSSGRSRAGSTQILRDPHASLDLFAPREESDQTISSVISPRGGARPRQRSFTEILGDEPEDEEASPNAGTELSQSPSKTVAPKAGSGKNYQPNRLFDAQGAASEESKAAEKMRSPEAFYRPNPKKFSHFEFGDGSDPQDAPAPGDPTPRKTKHDSQWSFEDFVTPVKPNRTRGLGRQRQDARHWGTENEEAQQNPPGQPFPGKPRKDAETHFEFIDDGPPAVESRTARPRGNAHNSGLGLYQNNLYGDDSGEPAVGDEPRALGNITNLKDRRRDFESNFMLTDESPAPKPQAKPASISEDRRKVVQMMDANWSQSDASPSQKENQSTEPQNGKPGDNRGIHIGGDGMGGSKGSSRNWLYTSGDGEDDARQAGPARSRKAPGAAAKSGGGSFWDF